MSERLEQTISSVEVAKMVEKEHRVLLRDIRRYSRNMSESELGGRVEHKIVLNDFWRDSTYIDPIGRTLPCYEVTKKGCEFIAHKMTGAKGTVFTALYINRFHEMEEALLDQKAIPASQSFYIPEKNDRYKARVNWLSYMLNVLEIELGLTGDDMLHQAYEGMKNDGLDIEDIKRRYMKMSGKTDFSTFEALLHDRYAAAELADILSRNMRIHLIQRCLV